MSRRPAPPVLFTRRRPARDPKPATRGPRPAAGLLLRHVDADGADWFLLGLRHPKLGGAWSNIGGSLERGEGPLAGAAREFGEEVGKSVTSLAGPRIAQAIECGTAAKPYTMFVVDVDDAFDDARLSWEHDDLAWWHGDDVARLALHGGFRRGWQQVER